MWWVSPTSSKESYSGSVQDLCLETSGDLPEEWSRISDTESKNLVPKRGPGFEELWKGPCESEGTNLSQQNKTPNKKKRRVLFYGLWIVALCEVNFGVEMTQLRIWLQPTVKSWFKVAEPWSYFRKNWLTDISNQETIQEHEKKISFSSRLGYLWNDCVVSMPDTLSGNDGRNREKSHRIRRERTDFGKA